MPHIPDEPTEDDARDALKLLKDLWGIHLTGVERDWGNGTSPCQHPLP
jgi:hypothetical protein